MDEDDEILAFLAQLAQLGVTIIPLRGMRRTITFWCVYEDRCKAYEQHVECTAGYLKDIFDGFVYTPN